jgi:hypothetical protein
VSQNKKINHEKLIDQCMNSLRKESIKTICKAVIRNTMMDELY